MYYYALSLRSAYFLMVNSSWTKNHVDAILHHSDPLLGILHIPLTLLSYIQRSLLPPITKKLFVPPQNAQIVYPPCDTREMAKFPLEGRERAILSVAQFR